MFYFHDNYKNDVGRNQPLLCQCTGRMIPAVGFFVNIAFFVDF
jgi:hypothetical protein